LATDVVDIGLQGDRVAALRIRPAVALPLRFGHASALIELG
jgi:hypothetical protein